jgi:hypothetical protein
VQARSIQAKIAADMEAPPGPLRSPDGLWWWDGKGWQPIASLGVLPPPPAAAAPVVAPEPVKEAAAPTGAWQPPPDAWQPPPAGAGPAPLPAQATEQVPRTGPWQPPPPPPAPSVAAPPPAPAPGPPPPEVPWPNWLPRNERSEAVVDDVPVRTDPGALKSPQSLPSPPPAQVQIPAQASSSGWIAQLYPARAALNANRQLATYVGLGILGLIALIVVVQVVSQSGLFGGGGGGATPVDTSPTGTQFQQADGFLSGSLNPALTSLATPLNRIALDCGGTHSVTCRNTLDDSNTAVVKAIAVIDKGPFPGCLAASVVQSRRDLVILDQALEAALIGFRSNSDALVTKGLADFTAAYPTLKTDGDALKATEQSACPKSP